MASEFKGWKDDGRGDCVHCHERKYDCRCDEFSAKALGFVWDSSRQMWRKDNMMLRYYDLVPYANRMGLVRPK